MPIVQSSRIDPRIQQREQFSSEASQAPTQPMVAPIPQRQIKSTSFFTSPFKRSTAPGLTIQAPISEMDSLVPPYLWQTNSQVASSVPAISTFMSPQVSSEHKIASTRVPKFSHVDLNTMSIRPSQKRFRNSPGRENSEQSEPESLNATRMTAHTETRNSVVQTKPKGRSAKKRKLDSSSGSEEPSVLKARVVKEEEQTPPGMKSIDGQLLNRTNKTMKTEVTTRQSIPAEAKFHKPLALRGVDYDTQKPPHAKEKMEALPNQRKGTPKLLRSLSPETDEEEAILKGRASIGSLLEGYEIIQDEKGQRKFQREGNQDPTETINFSQKLSTWVRRMKLGPQLSLGEAGQLKSSINKANSSHVFDNIWTFKPGKKNVHQKRWTFKKTGK
jgi:hypothetical protein